MGPPIFREVMPLDRFKQISRAFRFDDYESRRQNQSTDKFAPIRDIWNKWSELLPVYHNCGENVTIDEQLLAFHGRCSFRQYMPSKPAKYGIKFWVLVDTDSSYVWKIQPYLGKVVPNASPEVQQGKRVVLDLIDGLKGQNVTVDNFFTSHGLAEELLRRKLSIVGTLRQNKTFIPPKLKECKKVPLYTSQFAFTNDATLVSYIGRKNKCTILMSTLHHEAEIVANDQKKLPEIIRYYNSTKGMLYFE